jgi:hypothetical protein
MKKNVLRVTGCPLRLKHGHNLKSTTTKPQAECQCSRDSERLRVKEEDQKQTYLRRADVHGTQVQGGGTHSSQDAPDRVLYVAEGAGLGAVAPNLQGLPMARLDLVQLSQEKGLAQEGCRGLLPAPHPRAPGAVHVVEPHDADSGQGAPGPGAAPRDQLLPVGTRKGVGKIIMGVMPLAVPGPPQCNLKETLGYYIIFCTYPYSFSRP